MNASSTTAAPTEGDRVIIGGGRDECDHVCKYVYQGHCYASFYYHCAIECPSEWCPYCTTSACKTHGDFDIRPRCECDVVERHEDRR